MAVNGVRTLAFLLLVVVLAPASQSGSVVGGRFVEGFEEFTFPDLPESQYYEAFPSGVAVSTADANTGNTSLDLGAGGSYKYLGFGLGQPVCTNGVKFWLKAGAGGPAQGAAGLTSAVGLSGGPTLNSNLDQAFVFVGWDFGQTDVLISKPSGSTSQTVVTTGNQGVLSPSASVWRQYKIDCPANDQFRISDIAAQKSWSTTRAGVHLVDHFVVRQSGSTAEPAFWIDDIDFGPLPKVAGMVGSAQSVAVTGLVGFDVDVTGATAVARLASGSDIRTYAAGTLTASATVINTNCNRIDGVAALRDHVSFLHCDAGDATNVDQLWIRSSSLGAPDKGSICPNGSFCVADLDDEELAGAQDDQLIIASMQEYPFDFSVGTTSGFNVVVAGWAFSTQDGRAGVMTYSWVNNLDDKSAVATAVIDPSGNAPDRICTTRDNDGKSYLYAASQNSNVKGYQVTFSGNIASGDGTVTPSLSQVFPGTSATAGALSVGCGEGRFAVLTPSSLTVWNCRACSGQAPLTTVSVNGATDAGAMTMSDDGKWVAYIDSVGGHVINAETGEEVVRLTPPGGTFRSIELQGAGSNVWIATGTSIARYEVFPFTTGQDVAYDPEAVVVTPGSGSGDGIFDGSSQQVGDALGVGSTAGGMLLALIVIASLAASGLMALKNSAPVLGAVGGAVGGVVFSWIFGFLDGSVIFVMVLIGAAFFSFRFWNRGTAEGA